MDQQYSNVVIERDLAFRVLERIKDDILHEVNVCDVEQQLQMKNGQIYEERYYCNTHEVWFLVPEDKDSHPYGANEDECPLGACSRRWAEETIVEIVKP